MLENRPGPRSQKKRRSQRRGGRGSSQETIEEIKKQLHQDLLDSLDFDQVGRNAQDKIYEKKGTTLRRRIEARNIPLNRLERDKVVQDILDNVLGYGPIEVLIRDPEVSDILINGANHVYVDRRGKMILTDVKFENNSHLMAIIERIVVAVGRRVDEQHPMVDARMLDGSRFNAIIPPLALDGPAVSIRRFGTIPITSDDLVAFGSCPRPMMDLIKGAVEVGLNIVISGGTGSGKTTLLNVMSSFIPEEERIITIEDSAELQLQQDHVVRLETRPANIEGEGAVDQSALVSNSLRMRPDRIILGEIRGKECIDMLTAMNTGRNGSMATVHANNSTDALARLETMVGIGMPNMGTKAIRETIARAVDIIVQQTRLTDGTRRITSITEITGMEGENITSQHVFKFVQKGIDKDGKVRGHFTGTGIRPNFAARLAAHGIFLSDDLFKWKMKV